jgi:hypothetical protein
VEQEAREVTARLPHGSFEKIGPPTGRFNCHGLVFGARRTTINGVFPQDVDDLLRRDKFTQIDERSSQVGDVVVYRSMGGQIDHTGFVVQVDAVGRQPVHWVWSKWGSLGEYRHRVRNCPYAKDCMVEYWRLGCLNETRVS